MKQRDIELTLRVKGRERGVVELLARLGEEVEDLRISLKEMASMVVVMERVLSQSVGVSETMKNKIDRLESRVHSEEPGD